jgi:hypothetical protein
MEETTSVELTGTEAALLRSLIYTTAVTGMIAGPNGEVYAVADEGFDALLGLKNKLDAVPLPV